MVEPEHKRCLGCGYILDGLPKPRCPECGRGFDPEDEDTYLRKRWSGRPYLLIALCGYVALLAPFAEAIFTAIIAEAIVFCVSIRALRAPPPLLRHRNAFFGALALSFAFWGAFAFAIVRFFS